MNVILFNTACIFKNNEIILYGQYRNIFNNVNILINDDKNYEVTIHFCNNRPDFFIKIKDQIKPNYAIKHFAFHYKDGNTDTFTDLRLDFPFENCKLNLNKSTSAIISTMCKDYSHRLDEWIQYNLKLGFSGIVIFNNTQNTGKLNESTENCIMVSSMEEIANKYPDKVLLINYPFLHFVGSVYDTIQRVALSIAVNAFMHKCTYISLIDADEFIYLPKNPNMHIEQFLQKYNNTITMQSNILTNNNNHDIIMNNIIQIAKFVGENKYTKTILNTNMIEENEFIVSPHDHPRQLLLDKNTIIHYHCWINARCEYSQSMPPFNGLQTFFNS